MVGPCARRCCLRWSSFGQGSPNAPSNDQLDVTYACLPTFGSDLRGAVTRAELSLHERSSSESRCNSPPLLSNRRLIFHRWQLMWPVSNDACTIRDHLTEAQSDRQRRFCVILWEVRHARTRIVFEKSKYSVLYPALQYLKSWCIVSKAPTQSSASICVVRSWNARISSTVGPCRI